jgi:hypothetical protein
MKSLGLAIVMNCPQVCDFQVPAEAGEDLDFHLKLLCKHGPGGPREVRVGGPFSTGGVGHFYPGANNVRGELSATV